MQPEKQLIQERIKKIEELRAMKVEPFPYSFDPNDKAEDVLKKFKKLKNEEHTTSSVKVAGRVMTIRRMGKASFAHVQDDSGKIQFYIRQDEVGEANYAIFKKVDLGDFVGVEGTVFRTKMGEVTIDCRKFTLLTKAIHPLPEKWHGLKDIEQRYRHRSVDLISNPEIKKVFIARSKIIKYMREFLESKEFLEVETPMLQKVYGGASARPFKSFLHELKLDVFMRISPELYLKRLIVGGFPRVYEINRNFRNEGIDKSHNPEFTMMECYWAYADYNDMMKLTEDMIAFITEKVCGTTKVTYQGKTIDMKTPWPRLTMYDALKEYAKIDVTKLDDDEIRTLLRNYNIEYEGDFVRGIAISLLFEELVEDKLLGPVFIIDHPKETTPLCKEKRGDPDLIERFEPYIAGMEIGNAYSELNDPVKQRKLLEEQAKALAAGDVEAHPLDEEFLHAIDVGMPPTGGLGIGVDRIAMVLTDNPSIRDVILFPFMK